MITYHARYMQVAQKLPVDLKEKKVFRYSNEGDDVISELRTRKTKERPQQQKVQRVQQPWFNDEIKKLW